MNEKAYLTPLEHSIAQRVGRFLKRDKENSYLAENGVDNEPLTQRLKQIAALYTR